jgi:hypothetical protein
MWCPTANVDNGAPTRAHAFLDGTQQPEGTLAVENMSNPMATIVSYDRSMVHLPMSAQAACTGSFPGAHLC